MPTDDGDGGPGGALGRFSATLPENLAAAFSLTVTAAGPEVSTTSAYHLHTKTRQIFISSDGKHGSLPSNASVLGLSQAPSSQIRSDLTEPDLALESESRP